MLNTRKAKELKYQ